MDWFTGMGTEKSTGFGIFSLSGHVKNPGQFEAPLGITLRELLDMAGGMRDPDKELKFWTPGGSSTPLFTAEHLDVPLDFESVGAAGSMLGTRALQIFDETTCVVRAVDRWTDFYKHESCGKCTPCREGTWWLKQILGRLESGVGDEEDLDKLLDICDNILGRSFCALGDGATSPITSSIQYFRDEYVAHLTGVAAPSTRRRRRSSPRTTRRACPHDDHAREDRAGRAGRPGRSAAADLVTLTIDGVPVSVPKGTLIIRAAEQAGIEIPRFCDHPGLDPVGACRQCLVEVWMPGPPGPDGTPGEPKQMQGPPGRMKPQPSCTMAVAPGMVVLTQYTSEGADKAQKGVMELLLINHPLDCPVCDKGGECPLQNQAMSNGRAVSRFEDVKRTYPKPINISSQVLLDRERCVLCARCTRFSEQIAGDPFIALVERGALQQVGIYEEKPFESYFSGNTVQICPVGALTGAAYRFRSRPFDLVSTKSACEHCASGCAIRTDHRRGAVLRRMAWNDPEVNEEWNCDKGRWAFAYTSVGDRLDLPMVRGEDGELRVVSWRDALERAAAGLRAASSTGVLVGGRVSVEDAYAYGKFARMVLGTNDVDFRARPHSAEEAEFLASKVAGVTPETGAVTYADLESAKSVLLVGLEPEDESPIVFLRLRKAFRRHRTAVYAVSPGRHPRAGEDGGHPRSRPLRAPSRRCSGRWPRAPGARSSRRPERPSGRCRRPRR